MAGDSDQAAELLRGEITLNFEGVPIEKIYTKEVMDIMRSVFGEQDIYIISATKSVEAGPRDQFFLAITREHHHGLAIARNEQDKPKIIDFITKLGGKVEEDKL